MGQQEYDNFKRLIKEWLDSHPNEYADFVEEMNDKKFKGFFNIFNTAVRLVPKYKEAARKRIGDDRNPDFEELENVLLQSDLAEKIVNEFHTPNKRSIVPAMLAWLYYGRSYECMVEQGEELTKERIFPPYTNGLFPAWSNSLSEKHRQWHENQRGLASIQEATESH